MKAETETGMRIIKIYQATAEDNEGRPIPRELFFADREGALQHCNGWGGSPDPLLREAVVLLDGSIRLLEDRPVIAVYTDTEDMERQEALSKLTQRERELLKI